jgi:prephenate dehydratase
MAASAQTWQRIAFLGPEGTFSEEALLSIPALAEAEPIAMATIADALNAANHREVDAAFVPIENSIEGTVSATLDHLVFDVDLFIQLEHVLDVHLHLLAPPGTELASVRRVVSIPVALAQSRRFLQERLHGADLVAATSTAEAARLVGGAEPDGTAAIAPALAGRLYGLESIAEGVEDHADNQTRFVLVARGVLPPPTGHDRTSLVCFQQSDRPGSLHQILGQFAARSLNLTKIESRPTKLGLGDYCFVIELEGHLSDEVVGDCLKELHMDLAAVKVLGSYPVFGERGPERREQVAAARAEADAWLVGLRSRVRPEAGTERPSERT